ncbi:MAG: glycosyltransferase family 4 protein [Thermoflexales bacterium]
MRGLACEHDVSLIALSEDPRNVEAASLRSVCDVLAVVQKRSFHPRSLRSLPGFLDVRPRHIVDTMSSEVANVARHEMDRCLFDGVVACELESAVYGQVWRGTPALFDDVELAVSADAAKRARSAYERIRRQLAWLKMRKYVAGLLEGYQACTVVSHVERAHLAVAAPKMRNVHEIPNGVDTMALVPAGRTKKPFSLIYPGALTYGANFDAMAYFLTEIWPRILAAEPGVTLRITGKTDGVRIDRLPTAPNVVFTGYVDDIQALVADMCACVVPLRIGGGTRLKILEAMALGTPVVSTRKGAEGLAVTHAKDILLADAPEDFAQNVVKLLRSEPLRQELADHARALVKGSYDWKMIGDRFRTLVEETVRASAPTVRK